MKRKSFVVILSVAFALTTLLGCGIQPAKAPLETTENAAVGAKETTLETAQTSEDEKKIEEKAKTKTEGEGYDTPEDAIRAYAKYLKEGDINKIYSVFAVESYLTHYDMLQHYENYSVFYPYALPSQGYCSILLDGTELANELNIENRKTYISTNVYRSYIYCMTEQIDNEETKEKINNANPIHLEEGEVGEVVDYFELNPGFADMEIKEIMKPSDFGPISRDQISKYDERMKNQMDAEDVKDVCIRVCVDGKDYVIFMLAACYGNKWYLVQFYNTVSSLLGMNSISGGIGEYDLLVQ